MGICAAVECPQCHKDFVVSPSMLKADTRLVVGPATQAGVIEFHCPWCNVSFPKERSPRIRE
jgi:hypothetical protein